jgi:predicted GIY-YIG superfamily endonuclease
MKKTYRVYFIISPKGKIYVGYTGKTVQERFAFHLKNSIKKKNHCPAIENAIRHYGEELMIFVEVRECYSRQEACFWERRYIKGMGTTIKKNGYNLTNGGDGGGAEFREPASVETRAKIGDAAKGRGAKGVIGYHVMGYTVEFDVIKDAAKELNIDDREITKCAKGQCGSRGGFIWKYADEEERAKYPEWDVSRKAGVQGKPVYRILEYGTKDEYSSVEEAARVLGYTRSNIDRSIERDGKAYGYRWCFVE